MIYKYCKHINILSIDQKDNLLLFNQLGIALINKSLFISNPKIKVSFHKSNFQKSDRHVPTGCVGTPLYGEILFLLENELTFWSWNFIEICTNCHTYTFRKFAIDVLNPNLLPRRDFSMKTLGDLFLLLKIGDLC